MADLRLFEAVDVLPTGFDGTPWAAVYYALSHVLAAPLQDSENAFIYAAVFLFYVKNSDFYSLSDEGLLRSMMRAGGFPVLDFVADSVTLTNLARVWASYRATTDDFVSLMLASGIESVEFSVLDAEGLNATKVTLSPGFRNSCLFNESDDDATIAFFDRVRAFLPVSIGSTMQLVEERPSGTQYFFNAEKSPVTLAPNLVPGSTLYDASGAALYYADGVDSESSTVYAINDATGIKYLPGIPARVRSLPSMPAVFFSHSHTGPLAVRSIYARIKSGVPAADSVQAFRLDANGGEKALVNGSPMLLFDGTGPLRVDSSKTYELYGYRDSSGANIAANQATFSTFAGALLQIVPGFSAYADRVYIRVRDAAEYVTLYFASAGTLALTSTSARVAARTLRIGNIGGLVWSGFESSKVYQVIEVVTTSRSYDLTPLQSGSLSIQAGTGSAANLYYTGSAPGGTFQDAAGVVVRIL